MNAHNSENRQTVVSGNKLLHRRPPDRAQTIRFIFQTGFLVLNLWIGAQFYLWVRYYESIGESWKVSRPPGVEGWLPIASLMNLKAWLFTGDVPAIHPAGMFLLSAFLVMSLVIPKSFCSWLCPIGTLSEALHRFGNKLMGRNFRAPQWLDLPLRSIKYLLLGFFVCAVGVMSIQAIHGFLWGPYGIVADVRMLNFFRNLSLTSGLVIALLVVLSVFFKNFWCRYACPYGALMGLVSLASPVRIRRNASICIDCAKCSEVCPSLLPVDRLAVVRSPECTGCYDCVSVCPADRALEMMAGRRHRVRPMWIAAVVAGIFAGFVAAARLSDSWETRLPDSVYLELIPKSNSFSHPR